MSEEFAKYFIKVTTPYLRDYDIQKAIKGFIALNTNTPYDLATKHRYLATLKSQNNDFQGTLEHTNLSLETPVLNTREYLDLLSLEIHAHFELEQYEKVKQKTQNYFAYTENEDHQNNSLNLPTLPKFKMTQTNTIGFSQK